MQTQETQDYTVASEALRDLYLRSMRILDRMMSEQGASLARIKVMKAIHTTGMARSADLTTLLGCAPRTMTEAIDNLERDGLAIRVPDQSDRRVKNISLTETGAEMLASVEPIRKSFIDQLFSVLNEEELDQFTRLLGRLNDKLVELEPEQKAGEAGAPSHER